MNTAYFSLGSNEGDRIQWMRQAMDLITDNCGVIVNKSSIYETAAWGVTDQPDFLNMAIELATAKSPEELLQEIHRIETLLGRQRKVKWGQRTLDIDILLFNNEIIEAPGLTIPHPYLHERLFTLKPLAEIAPNYIHPKLHKSISQLLAECPDDLDVKKYISN